MDIIDLDALSKAIIMSEENFEMDHDDAKDMALHILHFFGFTERIIDNVLEPQDRDLFYMMEDRDLLVTEREETTLYDGREWRIHYWILCKDRIMSLAREGRQIKVSSEDEVITSLYDEMPEDIWQRS